MVSNKLGKKFLFLIDTGAHVSVIREEVIENCKVNRLNKIRVKGITGESFHTLGSVVFKLFAKNFKFSQKLQVLPEQQSSLSVDGILGMDFLTAHNVTLDFANWVLEINTKTKTITLPLLLHDRILSKTIPPYSRSNIQILTKHTSSVYIAEQQLSDNIFILGCIQDPIDNTLTLTIDNLDNAAFTVHNFKPSMFTLDEVQVHTLQNDNKEKTTESKNVNKVNFNELKVDGLTPEVATLVRDICKKFSDIFHVEGHVDKPAKGFAQKIFLKSNAVPRYVKQYPLPPAHRKIIAEKVRDMVKQGIAEPSISSWNAPVLVVPKKETDGLKDCRIVIDYRKLNEMVEDDKFPIPDITEILDGMKNEKFFTTLDLNQGYYQIELDKESRPLTAFSTIEGHWQLCRLPMGMKTSPSCFSRIMSIALRGLIGNICYVYLDDIIVYGKTVEEHAKNLALVFERLREVGLKVKLKKCAFFRNSVAYLGHIISEHGLSPDPEKFKPINEFPTPTTVVEVQSFLGLVNYYRRFVKDFAAIARPLYDLTKTDKKQTQSVQKNESERKPTQKSKTIQWDENCQTAFDLLKQKVTSPPVLAYPDFSKPFILQTDSSEFALGAVLMNHDRHPVAFLSRGLKKAEKNYHITDKELLAIVWSVKQLEKYLFGQKFVVQTDHRALV